MNSFTLMAEVISEPELRYTPDNNLPVASFLVQFPSTRPEEAPSRLKVTGWNNLATEISEKYHKGDRLVIEGRLNMTTLERNGYKEKRAEMTAQRIHAIAGELTSSPLTSSSSSSSYDSSKKPSAPTVAVPMASPPVSSDAQYDDIPF
jgi:single-strand DNA-binding protein